MINDYLLVFLAICIVALPLISGISMLTYFGKDKVSRCLGFFCIKPMFVLIIFSIVQSYPISGKYYWIVGIESFVFVEFLLDVMIFFFYLQVFNRNWTLWVFLTGDIIRWLCIFIFDLIRHSMPYEPFSIFALLGLFFSSFYPSLYSVIGLITVRKRAGHQTNIS
jgi:hypothetical protein